MNSWYFAIVFNVNIAYRGGGWDGQQGPFGALLEQLRMMSVGTQTMAQALLIGHRGSGSNPRSPIGTLYWYPSLVPLIVPVMTLEGQQNNFQKSRPVDM